MKYNTAKFIIVLLLLVNIILIINDKDDVLTPNIEAKQMTKANDKTQYLTVVQNDKEIIFNCVVKR